MKTLNLMEQISGPDGGPTPSVRVTAVGTGQDDSKERWITEARLEIVDGDRRPGFAS